MVEKAIAYFCPRHWAHRNMDIFTWKYFGEKVFARLTLNPTWFESGHKDLQRSFQFANRTQAHVVEMPTFHIQYPWFIHAVLNFSVILCEEWICTAIDWWVAAWICMGGNGPRWTVNNLQTPAHWRMCSGKTIIGRNKCNSSVARCFQSRKCCKDCCTQD